MALQRCKIHGRVYDDKDGKCPACVEEERLPRAPGGRTAARDDDAAADALKARNRFLVFLVLAVVGIGGGGAWLLMGGQSDAERAQVVRDSLRAAAAGPARPDTTIFARANDLSPIRRARAFKATLEALLRANRGTIANFPDGPVDTTVTERAAKRRVQQYLAFYKRWNDRLDAVSRNGTDFRYAPGVQYSLQMENVTNQLRAAISIMRDMLQADNVKPRSERRNDATSAAGYLHAAGTVLTNLPR